MDDRLYTVFIAEDMVPARELLVSYILERPELKLEGMARDGREALEKLSAHTYDLLFLDVEMPFFNGIEVYEKLEPSPLVIFTTSFNEFAVRAFDLCAVDYLLKPFTQARFDTAVDKAIAQILNADTPTRLKDKVFTFKDKNKYRVLPFEDIVYVSSHKRKTIIHTEEKCFELNCFLSDVMEKLPGNIFIRVHKQHAINMNKIREFEHILGSQYRIYLNDEDETILPIGQSFVSDIKKIISF
ncbi:MAG: DNA-binding response regulator [Spirochaetae bacterium HGW-Spirochaetae-1]|jgi:two-component system LytT family response regulator|nr:MAG: DNA-binding response regulator [Spirochaetae bacterium HGW-Spirochaetae-1]